MIKKIKYLALLVLSAGLLNACSEDLGNYDYNDINEVVFGNMDTHYEALLGEPFEVKPELSFTQDAIGNEEDYEYNWSAVRIAAQVLPAERGTVIGSDKDLILEAVQLPPGEYSVHYRVTDKKTGVQWNAQFYLNVNSAIYEGYMLLCDDNGTARLDMLSLISGEYTPIKDVLDYAGSSLKLEGAPKFVYCYPYEYGFYGVYVSTDGTGTTKIHPDTFDWKPEYYLSYEMLDASAPTDFEADFINISSFGSNTSLMGKDGNLYYYFRTFQYQYSIPINTVVSEAEYFKAAPFVADCYLFLNILYDEDNQRFLKHTYNQQSCSLLPNGTLFDYNTGKDLLYMTRTEYNGGEVHAILKDPADSKLYLARMTVSLFGAVNQAYYAEIPAEIAADMNQAENFAVSPEFGYLLYNVGSKVYEYDFSLKTSKLVLDKGNEEITLMKFEGRNRIPREYANDLHVYTYDSGAQNGAVERYTVPPVNGDLILETRHDGFGKIVSASYRIR
ncbi:PKD-like family lipoprotein [Aestuariibaculum sediminum]|uniref:PKD-like family protein n=1 Tax=Aestuariibaculum sediminum TaxID=2770637 RepID=A0A8J6QET9_9FLAO|nr:PKD-like family lipoprotein [Aestuariibaculum sediminum]MBD0830544.1 hypothetical protein [Aestuariibaculum sediminum]